MSINKVVNLFLLAIVVAIMRSCEEPSHMRLGGVLSDGIVLQQNAKSVVRGHASPGVRITVTTDWDFSVTTSASDDSLWAAYINVPAADNRRHTITVAASDTQTVVSNVLIGEVWLAMGQSNMELPLAGWGTDTIPGSKKIIEASGDSLLHFFMVSPRLGYLPARRLDGVWLEASADHTSRFGTLPYMFAKHLRDSLQVPVGIVQTVYGGAPLISWVNSDLNKGDKNYSVEMDLIAKTESEYEVYRRWLDSLPYIDIKPVNGIDPLADITIGDEYVNLSLVEATYWNKIPVPGYWENHGLKGFDGVVWFVRTVDLPQSWVGQDLKLYLGAVDDRDVTYVNGTCVGSVTAPDQFSVDRIYDVPSTVFRKPMLTIAVRVTDDRSKGGIIGMTDGSNIRLENQKGETIDLEGMWNYKVAAQIDGGKLILMNVKEDVYEKRPRMSLELSPASPSMVYNGLLSPLAGYSFGGVIFHAGEADVWSPQTRKNFPDLLPKVIKSVRKLVNGKRETPFVVAQIAPGTYNGCSSTTSAEVRNSFPMSLAGLDNVYLVSTLDLGSPLTLRPPYKDIEAQRMARVALKHVYNWDLGKVDCPAPVSATCANQIVNVTFENAEGLRLMTEGVSQFELAGPDSLFYPAKALVTAPNVTVFSHMVTEPRYVRYAGQNCSSHTLVNAEGLPSVSFVMPVE